MENIINYIDPMLIPIIIVLWCIGQFIKAAKPIRDELIPLLLVPAAVVLVALWNCTQGIPADSSEWLVLLVNALIQGVLCAAVAVWGNQIAKQTQKLGGEPAVTVTQAEFDSIAEAMGVSAKELQAVLAAAKKTTSQ